ncbi:MAG: PLP-dependent aminotransferase family protein [Acidimicrobiales bacterium]
MERGEVPGGVYLPAERTLAVRLAVSRTTVTRAYQQLREVGLVNARQGRGTVVVGSDHDRRFSEFTGEIYSRVLTDDDADVIDLTSACQAAGPRLRGLIAQLIDLDSAIIGHGYRPAGLPGLRSVIAEQFSGRGLPTEADQIVVTTGAQQAIGLLGAVLGRDGSTVLTEQFTFPGALDALRTSGLRPVAVAMDHHGIRPDELADAVAEHRPSLIYLTPSFNNPTGVELPTHRRRLVTAIAADRGIPVIDDATLELLSQGRVALPALAEIGPSSNVVTVGSLSKAAWGGLRVGWIRADRAVAERLVRAKAVTDIGSPILNQHIVIPVVRDIEALAAEISARVRRTHELVAATFAELLPDWQCPLPHGGLCCWVNAPGVDVDALSQVAQRHGVIITPGSMFSPSAAPTPHLRLPLIHAPDTMRQAVARIADAVRHLRDSTSDLSTRAAVGR